MENHEVITLNRELIRLTPILEILDRVRKLFLTSQKEEENTCTICRELGTILRLLGINILKLKRCREYKDIVHILEELKQILLQVALTVKRGNINILENQDITNKIRNLLEIEYVIKTRIRELEEGLRRYM